MQLKKAKAFLKVSCTAIALSSAESKPFCSRALVSHFILKLAHVVR